MTYLLAADIGGTKSDLAISDVSARHSPSPLCRQQFQNDDFEDFDHLLSTFLQQHEQNSPTLACLAVAAVVRKENVTLTNRNWTLDRSHLQQIFGFTDITLINDLTALCSAVPELKGASQLKTIQQGQRETDGLMAVIAPGTGLGEGFLINSGTCFHPRGSEGGHCDFAPLSREQEQLLHFLQNRYSSVSYEMLCSGLGIPHIFDFLSTTEIARDASRLDIIRQATDRTPPIVAGAIGKSACPLCAGTLSLFMEILGAEAGNLALKTYSTGGLFIGGGILPQIAARISFDSFLKFFRKKEKMTELMESIPVHLILQRDAALLGTISYARHLFAEK